MGLRGKRSPLQGDASTPEHKGFAMGQKGEGQKSGSCGRGLPCSPLPGGCCTAPSWVQNDSSYDDPHLGEAQTGIHCTCYAHHYGIYQCNMHTVLMNCCLLPQESFRELED